MSSSTQPDMPVADAARRPFRAGLLALDPARLLGGRCGHCGAVNFPAREFCPACRSADAQTTLELSDEGTVYSFTVVRQAPPGVEVPYVLAYVDLPERVRVMTQLDVAPEQAEIGMRVRLELHPVGSDEQGELVGYRFAAAAGEE